MKEVEGCSFKPAINDNSVQMVSNNYVPVYKKDLPGLKPNPPPPQEKGIEEVRDPHPKRKHNDNFYKEKMDWSQ